MTATDIMESLSAELKLHVFGLLCYQDLKSISLVNQTCALLAALHVFGRVTLIPLSLERLGLVAQREFVATCVKFIYFHADLLPLMLPELWHEEFAQRCLMETLEEESFQYHRYVLTYKEQQPLRGNN